jgi:hypothetical protein
VGRIGLIAFLRVPRLMAQKPIIHVGDGGVPLRSPILCTEYITRGAGRTFDNSLPLAKRLNVAAVNWSLVADKT